jgi:hypothetical protein
VLLSSGSFTAIAADHDGIMLARTFTVSVRPFLENHCLACHGEESPEAELTLSEFAASTDVIEQFGTWELVLERLELEEMPPADAERQPTAEERQAVIEWIRAVRDFEAQRNAGDPGRVLARRLSNAEYNYTIRDLTGVDIRPTKEFPVDPANEAGFDNSGESLAMTPALLTKYLDAARRVAEHLVLKPNGIDFAPHPVVTETDRDKYCVRRIIDFYERQRTDLADYFFAAWRFHHRVALGDEKTSLKDFAAKDGVSEKYLRTVWSLLEEERHDVGPLAKLQALWRELPPPSTTDLEHILRRCEAMRDFVKGVRGKLACEFPKLRVRGMHNGSQPLVLWRNRQYATHRMSLNEGAVSVAAGGPPDPDVALLVDPRQRELQIRGLERFCAVFPDKFYVSERGREFLDRDDDEVAYEKGRLLSAGFHSMMGYFRDDAPLYELLLDEAGQRELDTLWQELDFIASAPMRQHTGFIWFERTDSRFMISEEFDFARAEDKDCTSQAKIEKLAEVYLAKAEGNGASDVELGAIADHFENINASVRWIERTERAAEPLHLEALVAFAERAYRRPMTAEEREDLLAFYRSLRTDDGLDHDEAMRDALASVLMSPHFCYRLDVAGAGEGIMPLADYDLASRLSYFLWSSMPDEELLELAAAGELHRPEVLVAQARRMLADERVRGLATEFAGNWLDFRRFEEHNAVDRERFPQFTNELRQAMFEEPIRFFVDAVQRDRSILDLLYADHTFVNAALADHYGMTDVDLAPGEWVRVEHASEYGRGGLLAMSVFLTANSPGLRTSPVKRGYWVVRRVLGEHIPAPPPVVPELPADESQLGDMTLREVLARHREDKSCAACHERFDSFGLVFEGFGPVGEARKVDLGGRDVETGAVFPDGSEGSGVEGLGAYLRHERQEDFLDNVCHKLLSYGLGRTLIPSDDATLREMRANLEANDFRFGSLVETIVTSRQFLNKRGTD